MPTGLVEQHAANVTSPESACRFIIFSRFLLLIPKASLEHSLIFTRAYRYAQIRTVDEYLHCLLACPNLLPMEEQI